jgi:hypothetical protein
MNFDLGKFSFRLAPVLSFPSSSAVDGAIESSTFVDFLGHCGQYCFVIDAVLVFIGV